MTSRAALQLWIFAFSLSSSLVSVASAADLNSPVTAPINPSPATVAVQPFELSLTFVGELWHNDGGIKTRTDFMYGLDGSLSIDMKKLLGWQDGKFFIEGFYVGGKSLDLNYTGALQAPSALDAFGAQNLMKLYQLYYEQSFGSTDILVGKYDVQTQFATTSPMSLFGDKAQLMNMPLSSAGVLSNTGASRGLNGPGEYPFTAVGLRVSQALNDQWLIKIGLLDGMADRPGPAPNSTAFLFKSQYGVLGIGEVDFTPGTYTKLMAGVWGETGQFNKLGQFSNSFAQLTTWGEVGGYVGGATRLYTIEGVRGVDGFFNIGFAPDYTNIINRSYEGGLTVTGLFDARPKDKLGFAVAVSENSPGFKAVELLAGTHLHTYETDFELTYRAKIADWLTVQPEFDYIVNPSYAAVKNAFVFGLHFELNKVFDF